MMWNRITKFGAMLAMLILTLSAPAQANETREEAGRCAVRYLQAVHSTNASRIIAGYEASNFQDRAWQLIRTHQLMPAASGIVPGTLTFVEELNSFVRGAGDYLLAGDMREIMIFRESLLQADIDSGDADRRDSAVSALADCDQTFGFAPVTARPPVLSDFDCAAAYWLHAAINPLEQAAAGERAQFALGRHQAENAGLPTEEVIGQVQAAGRARYERIMNEARGLEDIRQSMIADGRNPDDPSVIESLQRRAVEALSLQNDLIACEAQYGFARNSQQ